MTLLPGAVAELEGPTEAPAENPGSSRATRRRLLDNVFSLYALQGLNYALPLAVLPYLVRVLGVENYGLIAFAQAFAQYFNVATDYGFNFSATKQIAQKRENHDEVSRLFWAVVLIKVLLMLAGMIALAAILYFVPRFRTDAAVYVVAYAAVVGNVLFPTWLFQGMERMRYISVVTGSAKLVAAVSLFIVVRRPSDYLLALTIQSAGTLLAGMLGFWIALSQMGIDLRKPSRADMSEALRSGWHLFISTAAISLYTNTNVFLVGLLAGNTQAGYFSAAEKLIRALQGLLTPITQAIFPHINSLASRSREAALKFIRKSLHWIGALALVPSIIMLVFAGPIAILVFGHGAAGAIPIVRWIALLPFVIALSNVFGVQTMVTFGMDKQFSRILLLAGVLNVAMAVPLVIRYAAEGAGAAVLVTEVIVAVSMWVALQRKGIHIVGRSPATA